MRFSDLKEIYEFLEDKAGECDIQIKRLNRELLQCGQEAMKERNCLEEQIAECHMARNRLKYLMKAVERSKLT